MSRLTDEQLIETYAINCDCEGTRVMLNGLRAVADAAVAADRAQREEPFCYASLNKQGDVTSVVMRKDSWRTVPLYTHPHHTEDKLEMFVLHSEVSDLIAAIGGNPDMEHIEQRLEYLLAMLAAAPTNKETK